MTQILRTNAYRQLIYEHGFGVIEDAIVAAARMGIVLGDAGPLRSGGDDVGRSRLGGLPDLLPDAEWPHWRGRPLSFIAQIALEDVARFDVEHVLPPSGLLSFFWDSGAVGMNAGGPELRDAASWGFDPADAGSSPVLYAPDRSRVFRRPRPDGLSAEGLLRERATTPRPRVTLPPSESADFRALGFDSIPSRAYGDLLEALDRIQSVDIGRSPTHQLLGYPDQIQNDMQLECQLVSHGLYCGDRTGYEDPRRATLEPRAREWRLLLQIDSDEAGLGVMWGDGGRIYFWIRDRDLFERRFDAVWLVLQCG